MNKNESSNKVLNHQMWCWVLPHFWTQTRCTLKDCRFKDQTASSSRWPLRHQRICQVSFWNHKPENRYDSSYVYIILLKLFFWHGKLMQDVKTWTSMVDLFKSVQSTNVQVGQSSPERRTPSMTRQQRTALRTADRHAPCFGCVMASAKGRRSQGCLAQVKSNWSWTNKHGGVKQEDHGSSPAIMGV